jgi:hypothetical protein
LNKNNRLHLGLLLLFSAFIAVSSVLQLSPLSAEDRNLITRERHYRDSTGREWILQEWVEGSRPYPKDIREREKWYAEKWGEVWYGPQKGQRIYSPGNWEWEVAATVPPDFAARIRRDPKNKVDAWGHRRRTMAFVWAPNGGKATDIYVQAGYCFYHFDVLSKKGSFIGNCQESGNRDGEMENALVYPEEATSMDSITGRLYFIQERTWRYVEKLLPYECSLTNKIVYLPAVLDWNKLYLSVKSPFGGQLAPVFVAERRSEPVFVVRSNPSVKTLDLPGTRIGKRPLITPDGKGVYFVRQKKGGGSLFDTYTNYEGTSLFDINTGKVIEDLKLKGDVPRNNWNSHQRMTADGPGTHGGNNIGYDGKIYTAQHGGAGGSPGRMFSIEPSTGEITMLYDSMPEDGSWHKRTSSVIDGPADAKSLDFTSTRWQVQCPRTGAIINGGWDNSGIRRYHDGFVTTIAGHNYGEFNKPARPGWSMGFNNVHGNSNPSVAPNGDLYIADVNYKEPRVLRIFRTDWPKEQPVNGYAEQFMSKDKVRLLMIAYAEQYIANFSELNNVLNK